MLAIEVEYLTGRAVATNREARNEPEWPPHPQRLFSALVAAMHECNFGDDARRALIWLESQQPPDLAVSKATARVRPETYVPINDSNAQIVLNRRKRTLKFMPAIDPAFAIGRDRKERHFPTVKPDDPVVQFIWPGVVEDELKQHRTALVALCEAVPYLGHSSSLVRVELVDSPREATLRTDSVSLPKDASLIRLRGITTGRLKQLEDVFAVSRQTSRRREATDAPWHEYSWTEGVADTGAYENVFGDSKYWFVFRRRSGKPLPLSACLALTRSVRSALLSACDEPPKVLSGHGEGNKPLDRTHVAFLPMANAGYRHSDGELHGFAIVLPREISHADRQSIAKAIGRIQKVWRNVESGKVDEHLAFDWQVEPASPADRIRALQPQRYQSRSRFWGTITPMVFGHFLRKLDEPRTHKIASDGCLAIGLPSPKSVFVSPTSYVSGVPQSYQFPSLSATGKPVWVRYRNQKFTIPKRTPDGQAVRMRYHVAVEFDEPVDGPVILGAGRYYGMGLCVPLPESRFPKVHSGNEGGSDDV